MKDFTKDEMREMYDAAWEAVDPKVRARAVEVLQKDMADDALAEVRKGVEEHGTHEWIHHEPFTSTLDLDGQSMVVSFHHMQGMAIRNALRAGGVKDADLPPFDAYYGDGTDVRNWDDYYVQALEEAAGAR